MKQKNRESLQLGKRAWSLIRNEMSVKGFLSLSGLAQCTGIPSGKLIRWARDETMPDVESLMRISDDLGIQINTLLNGDSKLTHPHHSGTADSKPQLPLAATGMFTVRETARLLRMSPSFVYGLTANRKITYVKIGRNTFISQAAIDEYMKSREVEAIGRKNDVAE